VKPLSGCAPLPTGASDPFGLEKLLANGGDVTPEFARIRQRTEELAAVFAIDICGYAVISNHIHLVLRVRPDLARVWSFKYLTLLEWTGLTSDN
jgi:hypothetical protein